MRGPSARCLVNTVDIYSSTPGQDVDGGYKLTPGYPTYPSVPCTVQVGAFTEMMDDQNRLIQFLEYKIMTAVQYNVKARDQIIYVDSSDVTHTLFVQANRDEAGRNAAFTIRAVERL